MKYLQYIISIFVVALSSYLIGMNTQQVLAITVLSSFILGTLFYWQFRLAFGLLGIAILLFTGLIDIPHLIEFASIDIILFLAGMMIIVGYLEKSHFFEFIIANVLARFEDRPKILVFILLLFSGLSAALVDEVTSILFILSIIFSITNKLDINPIPFVIMAVFATNIGSSATVVGNPVGVMIALKGNLSFFEFLRWATPISFISLILISIILSFYYKNYINEFEKKLKEVRHVMKVPSHEKILISGLIFLFTLTLLISHHFIEEIFHLQKNSVLITAALLGAGIVLLLEGYNARSFFEAHVDFWTLLFFMLLFASVGALKYVGVTDFIASLFLNFSGNNYLITMLTIMLSGGILSALLDNVLAVATFIPIIQKLAEFGINDFYLWWSLLFSATFFGNMTIIGSTANIIAMSSLERRNMKTPGFFEWLKIGVICTIPTITLAFLLLYAQVLFFK